MSDYRVNSWSYELPNIPTEKSKLYQRCSTFRSKNHYNLLGEHTDLKIDFDNVYGKKCVYCGLSMGCFDYSLFEIDHFVHKKSLTENVNDLSNLVLSCRDCNRHKSDFNIDEVLKVECHPDVNINSVFFRNDDFRIVINDKYLQIQQISNFYQQVELGSELKRLDYLVILIAEYINRNKECCDKNLLFALYEVKDFLMNKRNWFLR